MFERVIILVLDSVGIGNYRRLSITVIKEVILKEHS